MKPLTLPLINGPLDGSSHVVHGRFQDVIELPWTHSSTRHIYELYVGKNKRFFYLHVKSYRPATQDCKGR